MNSYKRAIEKGWAGSRQDFTWNKVKKIHECCNSGIWWRHKKDCLQVTAPDEEVGNKKWKALDSMNKRAYLKKIFS